jgi:YVTN family beta-propeller protein
MAFAVFVALQHAEPSEPLLAPPDSGTLVVANLRHESLTFIDFHRGEPERRVLQVPGPPHEMVEADGRLYVTLGRAGMLVEVDPAGPAILRTLALGGDPHGIALQGPDLLISLDSRAEVARVQRATLAVDATFPAPATPHAIAAHGTAAYVTGAAEGIMAELATNKPRVISVGAGAESIALASGHIATADSASGTVSVVDRSTFSLLAQVPVGPRPSRVIVLPSGELAVALNGGSAVAIVDPLEARVVRRVPAGPAPDGLCTSPDRAWLAVTSAGTGRVTLAPLPGLDASLEIALGPGAGGCHWLDTSKRP